MKNVNTSQLLDQYLTLVEGLRNKKLLEQTWRQPNLAYMGDIGVPERGVVPVVAVPHLSMWARKMGRSVAEVFHDPQTYLEVFLSREIGRFTQIQDDRPLTKKIPLALGCGFESTLFGMSQHYSPTEDPWVGRTPLLLDPQDLDRLQRPDFFKSGLMPLAHRYYHELSERVADYGLEVEFHDWGRSPFGVAVQLRGMEQLLVDIYERPDFFVRLHRFITDSAIHYRRQRASFLGVAPDPPVLHDDDINVPSISPQHYRDLVLPEEKAYASVFGGLMYWHSCGNVTPMIPAIREIDGITIFHVGPWTDLAKAAGLFGDTTLDVCLTSLDVYQASEVQMRDQVLRIVQTCREHGAQSFSIRPGILETFQSVEQDLASAARWVRIAKQTLEQLHVETA